MGLIVAPYGNKDMEKIKVSTPSNRITFHMQQIVIAPGENFTGFKEEHVVTWVQEIKMGGTITYKDKQEVDDK